MPTYKSKSFRPSILSTLCNFLRQFCCAILLVVSLIISFLFILRQQSLIQQQQNQAHNTSNSQHQSHLDTSTTTTLNTFNSLSNPSNIISNNILIPDSSDLNINPNINNNNNNINNINNNQKFHSRRLLDPVAAAAGLHRLPFSVPLTANDAPFPIANTLDDIHFVVTTGCSGYQNWQTETLLYSWAKVSQPGRFTRIIAGCKDDKEKLLANTTAVPNEAIHDLHGNIVHRINWYFVPDYTPSADDNKGIDKRYRDFHYFNKPYGMQHWLKHMKDEIYESVLVLIDPDMLVLKRFMFHNNDAMLKEFNEDRYIDTVDGKKYSKFWVREGHPVSQKYGIGPKWVKWTGFCDDRPGCQIDDRVAWDHYSIGPPYMMHKNDWLKTIDKWVEFSPGALEWEPQPSILAEMYSYSMASAYYDLKHQELLSMVSAADSSASMEAWNDVNWDFVENNPTNSYQYKENLEIYIIHYCQGYWLGETRNEGSIRNGGWNWHKGHVPLDLMYNCEIPLFVELGNDINGKNFFEMFGVRDKKSDNRYTWILYHLFRYVNQAAANYKLTYCKNNDGSEWKPKYELVLQQPESDRETHRRMNYVIGDYESKKSWRGN